MPNIKHASYKIKGDSNLLQHVRITDRPLQTQNISLVVSSIGGDAKITIIPGFKSDICGTKEIEESFILEPIVITETSKSGSDNAIIKQTHLKVIFEVPEDVTAELTIFCGEN